ncbi:phytanoyl-CoA dioxygenase family protein [Caballeronia grimmiae]|uniref:L-proline 4-hydroxylase n=1 Tax=Caballeronia grimmiae TaxID=1071679 RepID=A0A069PCK5_9BURK|nr:phytanoyl-CoA dioxygenase family protein [Caballeronia grimmiae]KDR35026.1 phytanoyl-CoA dioxygenase [Caballeronia grimmiae]GGD88385.1 L-proline 4-hydroxylase [Caballeronia grimmiae]
MELTKGQIADYHRDGFIVIPDCYSREEVQALRRDTERLSTVEADSIFRERTGAIRSIFRVHEEDGPVASPQYRALTRTPRLLRPVMQALDSEEVYIAHTKVNTKSALEGTGWLWHQDFGYWVHDGYPENDMLTAMVMLSDTQEIHGSLYMIPGSHKLGLVEHYYDDSQAAYQLPQRAVQRERIKEILETSDAPVPIVGRAGTLVLFHCLTIHGSGVNMSAENRWQAYITYNRVANRPHDVEKPRGDFVRSTNWAPLPIESDDGILCAGQRREERETSVQGI